MSKNNVRIAIRDSTDSHNVAFFDNKAGIKYKSANLHRFLAGSASILTIKYNSKDIDSIRSGCKLAFRYKNRDYWLNVMSFEKKGFEVELTAYSLGLELNNETRGEHKPANAMSIAEYVAYYDPEHVLTIGVNEVSDKRIKLEWTGTDTILARLFSVANSFGAELDFNVELNDDYSLKRQVLNIYKKGNLGTNKVSQPVRVGKELKVINYSDNIKELRTAVRATGKDGLTIDGLNKEIYDNNKELLYYSSGMTVYAPQSRDRFPSVGKGSNDNWIVKDLGETQYETKEALWGYMYGEIQKISVPEITYEVEGAIDAGIGDTQTLIDDIHFEPALYVQARVSELEDDILTGKVTNSTFINFERKYSQIADSLLKQVEALAEDAAPYIVRLSTDNGYNFKNGQGTSTITAKLEKYSKIVNAKWKWLINNSVVSETSSVKINASQVNGTLNVVAVAIVGGSEAAREYITFTNVNDGLQGPQGPQGDEGPKGPQGDEGPKGDKGDTGNGIANTVVTYGLSVSDTTEPATWSSNMPTLVKGMYLWTRTVYIYTNGESTTSYQISYIAKDADATAAIDKTKQELLEKLDTVRNDSLAAVGEAKQELATVADDLSKAKTDLQNAVSAVDTKATNLKSDLSQAKQDLTSQAQQLQAQANAQSELTNRVSSVEETANGTKTTVSELSKTVAQNGKDITSVTARTKTVEDDLSGTKTTLTQVQTTANSASQKTATLETGLNGLTAKFENLQIGTVNLLHNSKGPFKPNANKVDNWQRFEDTYVYLESGKQYVLSGETDGNFTSIHDSSKESDNVVLWLVDPDTSFNKIMSDGKTGTTGTVFTWNSASGTYQLRVNTYRTVSTKSAWNIQIEEGNLRSTYSQNESDIESKVAEYKQTADQNYASLSSTVQTLDGQVQSNKTTAEQTAQGFKTRIESLETYKNGESERANAYFESAKTETAKQLTAERTAIANNYVAKSTYTSDVTGIRNDLSATTSTANSTKTNLANYQASNDKAVANLQSNLQTANGNISSLKTKVEAVPGQITSAVSAVEGKIPTEIGAVNLLKNSKSFTGSNIIGSGTLLSETYQGCAVRYLKVNRELAIAEFNNCVYPKLGGKYVASFWAKGNGDLTVFFHGNSGYLGVAEGLTSEGNVTTWGDGLVSFNLTADWKRYWVKYKMKSEPASATNVGKHLLFRTPPNGSENEVYLAGAQLEEGSVVSGYEPAPEDTATQISNLSSEIKQTADGITLLATKTELNTAKNELQSGINTATNKANSAQSTANSNAQTISTHTTQISALNTGLQAKVSQTEFNTLSGRVTTAENNITAKANELSSKITAVEGKIPTSVGGTNYLTNISSNWQNKYVVTSGANAGSFIQQDSTTRISPKDFIKVEAGKEYTISLKELTDIDYYFKVTMSTVDAYGVANSMLNRDEWIYRDSYTFTAPEGCKYVMISVGCDAGVTPDDLNTKFNIKVERGNIPTDYSPAPEDYDSALATAKSEIKQTTDAITASVSSVQTAASNAQSTANTAVSKADAAQAGVNTLDSTTVKSASLTINADGIVMKAGKSTTDVANAIGSYFAVNQNAINLFADKIKVKGDMIVDGAITADKFKAARITSLNGATTFDLDSGNITFKKNLATINQVNGNYKSEVSLSSIKASIPAGDWSSVSTIAMDSTSFNTSKRRAGMRVDMMPTYSTTLITGETISFAGETESLGTVANSVSVTTEAAHLDIINKDTKGPNGQWNYPMIMDCGINAAIRVPDIKVGGYTKSLKAILNDLCKKAGILWT